MVEYFLIEWAFGRIFAEALGRITKKRLAQELRKETDKWARQLADVYQGLEPRTLLKEFFPQSLK